MATAPHLGPVTPLPNLYVRDRDLGWEPALFVRGEGGVGESCFFLIQFYVPFKIISAHMRRANQ